MKSKTFRFLSFFVLLVFSTTAARADQLILKNGKEFSGKFVRANTNLVEFRSGGKVMVYKTIEVSKIIFWDPSLSRATSQPGSKPDVGQTQPPVRHIPPEAAPIPSATFLAGTGITVRTTTAIDTDRHRAGDSFTAILEDPLMHENLVVVARGAEVKGKITTSKESGPVAGRSELALELTEITANGRIHLLKTGEYSEIGSSRGKRTAATVGGAAAAGAAIGAIAGGGRGAAIGAAVGAAAGTGVQLITRGQTLKIPAETLLEFKLEAPLKLPIP